MNARRTVLEVDLRPLAGRRFQPTGFPDLGAAEFDDADGGKALLVESAQSMANRLEATTWDEAHAAQPDALSPLPYVRIVSPEREFLSSSRLEAHRLASAYVMQGKIDGEDGSKWMLGRLGLVAGRPLDYRAVARACFALDPVSLVHGVFFARKEWPWQPKIARAVTSFVEAYQVIPAVSGGVKRDSVVNEGKEGATSEGYGMVPYHRVEYTAGLITAYFTVDHQQFRSYGLSEPATALLEALADFEIASLLDGGLRLRTACDLAVHEVRGERPDVQDAAGRIAKLAIECSGELGEVTEVVWSGRAGKGK
ncbi:MAG TPA: type I-U CRISPR-associated RAMP protein Csb1/Cas7u [Streptosporangiaceae bacterium]|nr:type I-U CRISPR-associated RAMP protein Csb1/Cas7u [Streptosporangiaceae bacterium]